MREERLLERLRRSEGEPLGGGRANPKRAVDSVARHLQRLLNTRQGSVPIADDYGIPDIAHLLQGGPEAPAAVEDVIRDVIAKFEPRLAGVQVRYVAHDPEKLTHRFEVQAKLRADARPVSLETRVDLEGRIHVERGGAP